MNLRTRRRKIQRSHSEILVLPILLLGLSCNQPQKDFTKPLADVTNREDQKIRGHDQGRGKKHGKKRTDPSAPGKSNPGQAQACLAKVKAKMPNRMHLLTVGNAALDPEVAKINQALKTGTISDDDYIRTTNHPGRFEGLDLDRTFSQPASANQDATQVKMDYVLRAGSSDQPASVAELENTAEVYENGNLTGTVEQVVSFESGCTPRLVTHSYTSFIYQGNQVNLTRINYSEDGGTETDQKTISKSLIDGKIRGDQYKHFGSLPARVSIDSYMDFDDTDVRFDYSLIGSSQPQLDPIKKQSAPFKLARIDATQDQSPIYTDLIAGSPLSDYTMSKITVSAAPGQFQLQEDITAELWNATQVVPDVPDSANIQSDTFTEADMSAPSLPLTISAARQLQFDNIAAYGILGTPKQSGGRFTYSFVSESAQAPVQAKPIDKAQYTRSTVYYDYNSPKVAAVVDSVRQQNLSTADAQAKAILKAVSFVKYDFDALNDGTVRPLKASDVLAEGKGVCQNYAALVVAVSRGLGIPARTVEGPVTFAPGKPNSNEFVAGFHAWVELSLDGQTWTPIEPQWADSLGLPTRGYIPFGAAAVFESQDGNDFTDQLQFVSYLPLDLRHAPAQ